MLTKTHVKSALVAVMLVAVIARTPAKEYLLGEDKFLGIF